MRSSSNSSGSLSQGPFKKYERYKFIHHIIFDNFSFKVVSFFVAMILWVSILGRRDFVTTKEIDVNFITNANLSMVSQSHDRIRVKLSGSQALLKKYKDSFKSISLDISDQNEGVSEVEIPIHKIELPAGIKILSVRPNLIKVELSKKSN